MKYLSTAIEWQRTASRKWLVDGCHMKMVQVTAHIHGRLSLTKEAPITSQGNLMRICIQYPS